jgi:hypothetical protein
MTAADPGIIDLDLKPSPAHPSQELALRGNQCYFPHDKNHICPGELTSALT